MIELNHNTLSQSLRHLPAHTPPESLWDRLETALEEGADSNHTVLAAAVAELPRLEPSPLTWLSIEHELEQQASPLARPRAPRYRIWVYVASGVAASVALVVAAFAFFSGQSGDKIDYSVEPLTVSEETSSTNKEESALQLLFKKCESDKTLCANAEFARLRAELDELDDAKTQLQQALGRYGNDPTLKAQLEQVEQERTLIIHQLLKLT